MLDHTGFPTHITYPMPNSIPYLQSNHLLYNPVQVASFLSQLPGKPYVVFHARPYAGSQFLEPDGWFPNHVPNPEDASAMAAGVHAVQQSGSDLGVVLDTDVDRSAVVARDGQPINSNRYIALMSLITLRSAGTLCPAQDTISPPTPPPAPRSTPPHPSQSQTPLPPPQEPSPKQYCPSPCHP